MYLSNATIPTTNPDICIYCRLPIFIGEPGWGWFKTGEKWHTECLQVEGGVEL